VGRPREAPGSFHTLTTNLWRLRPIAPAVRRMYDDSYKKEDSYKQPAEYKDSYEKGEEYKVQPVYDDNKYTSEPSYDNKYTSEPSYDNKYTTEEDKYTSEEDKYATSEVKYEATETTPAYEYTETKKAEEYKETKAYETTSAEYSAPTYGSGEKKWGKTYDDCVSSELAHIPRVLQG